MKGARQRLANAIRCDSGGFRSAAPLDFAASLLPAPAFTRFSKRREAAEAIDDYAWTNLEACHLRKRPRTSLRKTTATQRKNAGKTAAICPKKEGIAEHANTGQ